jgi:hypothetical protein
MEKEFDPEKSHQENVKIAVDLIIGEPTNLKRKRKADSDNKRILFKQIIEGIIQAEERSIMLDEGFSIDLNKHNLIFYEIIENFFKYNFTKDQNKLIDFYLYDRYSADGSVLDLLDDNKNPIKLDTVEDLWYLLKSMEPKNAKEKS